MYFDSGCEKSGRLCADNAVVSGTTERRTDSRCDRLYPFDECEAGEAAGTGRGEEMSTAILEPRGRPPRHNLNADYSWKTWLFTLDHKRIALLYLVSVTFFFLIGGFFPALMCIQLVDPRGAPVEAETYYKFLALHGVVMIFFFLIPSIPAVL